MAIWLTQLGRDICGDSLPPLKDIRLGSYRHDRMLVDLELALIANAGGRFTPERRLRQMLDKRGVGERGHVADGWLHLENQTKPIAIELELSTKGHRRLKQIVRGYAANLDIGEVWYFVECDTVRRHLIKATKGWQFVKIHDLLASCSPPAGNQVPNRETTPARLASHDRIDEPRLDDGRAS